MNVCEIMRFEPEHLPNTAASSADSDAAAVVPPKEESAALGSSSSSSSPTTSSSKAPPTSTSPKLKDAKSPGGPAAIKETPMSPKANSDFSVNSLLTTASPPASSSGPPPQMPSGALPPLLGLNTSSLSIPSAYNPGLGGGGLFPRLHGAIGGHGGAAAAAAHPAALFGAVAAAAANEKPPLDDDGVQDDPKVTLEAKDLWQQFHLLLSLIHI